MHPFWFQPSGEGLNRLRIFEFGRTPNDYFGIDAPGPHLAPRELLRRYPDILSTSTPPQLQSNFIKGIKHRRYHH
jgi:hypothetical protein